MSQTSNRRNFLLPVTVLAFAAALFFGFKYYQVLNTGIIPVVTDTTKCGPCMAYNNNINPKSSQLELNLLKTMAFKYQNPISASETRSVWFNLDTLKKFIFQIEKKTCNTCTGNLGIRIYYGRYPTITTPVSNPFADLNGLDVSYTNIHTLFMVPTIDKPDGYHYDFDPAVSCNPYEYKKMDTTGIYPPGGTTVTALMAQNHGDACPPLPPGGGSCPAIGAFFNK